MDYKDYYSVLGVVKTATQAEIKKAYRKLARQHHPDRNAGDKAAEAKFKDLNEANEVLSDPAKRKQYDELGANWEAYARSGAGAAGRGGADPFAGAGGFGAGGRGGGPNVRYEFRTGGGGADQFSDFFRTFFGDDGPAAESSGGGGPRARQARSGGAGASGGSLEDILAGMGGSSGGFGAPGAGGGRLAPAEAEAEISLEEAYTGTARLVDVEGRRLEVKIPAGVDSGSRIRLSGKGGGSGSTPRDLYIVPKVRPHPVFTRNGPDITRELRVTLEEALLGAEVPVGTLTGRLLLTLPAGTQHGRTFRLTGQGMPRLKGDGRGDLYVRVSVVLPGHLSDEATAAAKAFLELVDQPNPRGEA